MASIDTLSSRLSFFGRVTDDFRREPVWQGEYRVLLETPPTEALYKRDGHFTFSDLPPSPTPYDFRLLDGLYQARQFAKSLPTTAPVEITYDGEDEIYVFVKTVNTTTKQITFDAIPFLPLIRNGADVLVEGGSATTLTEDLAGVDVTTAALASLTGVTKGKLLRIVRSRCLRGKAGPYYPFPDGTTVLQLKVTQDGADEPPLVGAKLHIVKVNAISPSTTTVGGVTLHHLTLSGPPVQKPVLGTDADLDAFTDTRGNAVFYFPAFWTLTSLEIAISSAGYLSQTKLVPLTAGQTASATVKLASI